MTPIKWVGSKRWHVPQVGSLWDGNRVVELFAGSAAVSFGLSAGSAHLNDINGHLMNFYNRFRDGIDWSIQLGDNQNLYYQHRDWFNELIGEYSPITAQLFYFLNQHAFNNLWRINAEGLMNVPYRAGRSGLPPDESLRLVMKNWTLSCGHYTDVVLQPDDFVYADPPYDGTFSDYDVTGFTWQDQIEVAAFLREHPGRVILMNAATDRITDLYHSLGYHQRIVRSAQKMHLSRGRSDVVPEVMATNFPIDQPGTIEASTS